MKNVSRRSGNHARDSVGEPIARRDCCWRPGRIFATPSVLERFSSWEIEAALRRHVDLFRRESRGLRLLGKVSPRDDRLRWAHHGRGDDLGMWIFFDFSANLAIVASSIDFHS